MPKINLTFDEFVDVVGCMRSWIDEIDHIIPEEARRLQHLYDELQERYAKATVEDELSLAVKIYTDTDSVYAPDPEDFKEVP